MHKKLTLGVLTVIAIGVVYILFSTPVNSIRIYVYTPLGENVSIRINRNDTINDLKKQIEKITALPVEKQELSFGDVKLDGDAKIGGYNIKSRDTIELNVSKNHDHSYGQIVIIKEPTCQTSGQQKQVCDCGEESVENIPKLEHIKSDWIEIKKPTQTETGLAKKFCALCQKELDERITPKLVSDLKDDPKIPQTGDETNASAICVISFFVLISIGGLCYTNFCKKKTGTK